MMVIKLQNMYGEQHLQIGGVFFTIKRNICWEKGGVSTMKFAGVPELLYDGHE